MSKKYVIRYADGRESSALDQDEIENRIRKKEISENDEVAVLPGRIFVPFRTVLEFEEAFTSLKSEPVSNDFSFSEDESTIVFEKNKHRVSPDDEKTRIFSEPSLPEIPIETEKKVEPLPDDDEWSDKKTREQATKIFEPPKALQSKDFKAKEKRKFGIPKKSVLVMILLVFMIYEYMFEDEEDEPQTHQAIVMRPVRPQLPGGGAGKVDPEASMKFYSTVLKFYMEDTVKGYKKSVQGFQYALRADPQNVKALAMLASSYINLIDSSNKDENTFAVINKLIELSKIKEVDLVETLMAEVEFLAVSRRYDAGIQRLIEYYKVTGKIDPVLYYYLGWLYSLKHEYANAMKYLNQIPASALPIPKLYYLRGILHEENKEYDEAKAEYSRALKINPQHAKSILGLVRVSEKKGELKSMTRYVEFLTSHPSLQSPPEYVESLNFEAKLALVFKKPDVAIHSLEQAIQIEPKNEDLKLEYYTLLAGGDEKSPYRNLAKMYALILEGERLIKNQQYHEASALILQARDSFPKSELPLVKMGDLFFETGEFQKSRNSYEKALEMNPKAGDVATKLIDALIKNRDYEDAQKYLSKYRNNPKLKSSIDRLAGDLSFQQGFYPQAIQYYRKAMARDTVDTEVYASYASALRELDQCKDAQFFYTLSQRLDPFNYSAIVGSAKCLLKTDGVSAAVSRIQDELSKLLKARPDLLNGIAEIYFIANDYDRALQFTAQAKDLDPDYPDPYKIEAQIYLKLSTTSKKDYYKKALDSFKAYSDRKVSDPYGYVQRFELFMKESNFEQANNELNRIFEISPRFPELHYRRAQLLAQIGRSKEAIAELDEELKINPRLVKVMIELGNIYIRLNNVDEAMKNFTKAMELDPANPQAKMGAGYVNYMKRQFPSAIALYQAALSLDRGNPEIYKKLGLAYRDSGDRQKATQAFRNYLDLAPDAPDRNEFEGYR